MTNEKVPACRQATQNPNRSLNDQIRSKYDVFLLGFGVLSIHLIFVIWILSFGFNLPASAVTVTVLMDGTGQILTGLDGNPMPTGEVVQIICASGDTVQPPNQYGEPSGGDRLLWSGKVGAGGMGIGAFIKDFAGSQSLSDQCRIYVRAWNGTSLVLSDHYGDSLLSDPLSSEVGDDPPVPVEWSATSFGISNILTPEPMSNIMNIVSVRINGIRFRSGDIISSKISIEAVLSSEAGAEIDSVDLWVDNVPLSPSASLHLVSGTSLYGTWIGNFTLPESSQRRRLLSFHMENYFSLTESEATMEARILGGSVQVVGATYNYPNPFKPMSGGATNIQYVLSRDSSITLVIYDITGHETKRMRFSSGINGGRGGVNQVSWNGRSLGGDVAGNGMYLYKIISGDRVIGSGKLVVLD